MKLQFLSQITKVETTADRGMRIKLITPELSSEEMSMLFKLGENQVYTAIAELPIKELEVPDDLPTMKGEKTPSQRLKNVLHVLWEQKTDRTKSSDQFYRDWMEKAVEGIKAKLD